MNMASQSYRSSCLFGSPVMPSTRPFRHVHGLRVLVVDDDLTSLNILEKMLMDCLYEVTKCNGAEIALNLLRDNPEGFDIVISEVHLPDMDGFQLLKKVGLDLDLPLILMSADGMEVVKIGMTYGACNYLIKPVSIEALRNISQHVRIKVNEDDASLLNKPTKPRVVWTIERHQKFVAAVNQLGIEKATPKKILDLMDVPGLTRENVASHFQKYRLYLKRPIHDDCNLQALASTQLLPMYSQGSLYQQPCVVWSVELHLKFVSAVNQLGIDKATPEKILDLMNVPALTQENITRHLVKYQARIHRPLHAQSHGCIGGAENPFTVPGSSQASLETSNGQHIIGNEVSQPSPLADISPNIKISEKAKTIEKKSPRGGNSRDDKPGKDHWVVELGNIVGSSTLGSKRSLFQLGFSPDMSANVLDAFDTQCSVSGSSDSSNYCRNRKRICVDGGESSSSSLIKMFTSHCKITSYLQPHHGGAT